MYRYAFEHPGAGLQSEQAFHALCNTRAHQQDYLCASQAV